MTSAFLSGLRLLAVVPSLAHSPVFTCLLSLLLSSSSSPSSSWLSIITIIIVVVVVVVVVVLFNLTPASVMTDNIDDCGARERVGGGGGGGGGRGC